MTDAQLYNHLETRDGHVFENWRIEMIVTIILSASVDRKVI